MLVGRGTIHHEGAGDPTDDPRGSDGGYTYWIGSTKWTRLRSVDDSWATYHFNHVSVDVCLSGNREVHPTTANDIKMIGECFADSAWSWRSHAWTDGASAQMVSGFVNGMPWAQHDECVEQRCCRVRRIKRTVGRASASDVVPWSTRCDRCHVAA